jgi:hypothetical protein
MQNEQEINQEELDFRADGTSIQDELKNIVEMTLHKLAFDAYFLSQLAQYEIYVFVFAHVYLVAVAFGTILVEIEREKN